MTSKKKILTTLSVVLILGLAVLGILAYLTDQDGDVNVMTMGEVDIEQTEVFEQGIDLYPGEVVTKEVTVKNVGKSDAYVRTWFAFEMPMEGVIEPSWAENAPDLKYVTTEKIGDTEYKIFVMYYDKMEADTAVDSLKGVKMLESATNEDVAKYGDTYEVLVFSQAVQTNGFDDAETALNTAFTANHPWTEGVEIPVAVATADELTEAVANGDDVYLTTDINMNKACVTIPENTTVTINLNGHTLTSMDGGSNETYMAVYVSKGANLTLNDYVGTGKIVSSCYGVYVKENATFTMNGGTIDVKGNGVYDFGVCVWNGEFVMNGGTINAHIGIYLSDYYKNNSSSDVSDCKVTVADGCTINAFATTGEYAEIEGIHVFNEDTENAVINVPTYMNIYTNWNDVAATN